MAATRTFIIGAQASCTDGVCGDVIRVVVDPITRTVTHLVVEPKHRIALGRLVPLTLVEAPRRATEGPHILGNKLHDDLAHVSSPGSK